MGEARAWAGAEEWSHVGADPGADVFGRARAVAAAAKATEKGAAEASPFGSKVSGEGSRTDIFGVPLVRGASGKENRVRRGGYLGHAASVDAHTAAAPHALFPAGASDARARSAAAAASSAAAVAAVAAGINQHQRRSGVDRNGVEVIGSGPASHPPPTRIEARVSTATVDASSVSGRSDDSGPLTSLHLLSGVGGDTGRRWTAMPALHSPAGGRLTGESSLSTPEDHERFPMTTVAVPANDLAQARAPAGLPSVFEGEDTAAAATAAAAPAHGRRPRPAPRRPLELLLDETSRYATVAGERSRRGLEGGKFGGGGGGSSGANPPLSNWVVSEMNRLFGVRSLGGNDATAGSRGTVYRVDPRFRWSSYGRGEGGGGLVGDGARGAISDEVGLSWSAGGRPETSMAQLPLALADERRGMDRSLDGGGDDGGGGGGYGGDDGGGGGGGSGGGSGGGGGVGVSSGGDGDRAGLMRQVPLATGCARGDIRGAAYGEGVGRREGDPISSSSVSISGKESLSPQDTPSARQSGGGNGSGGGNTAVLGDVSNYTGVPSARVLDDARWGSTVGAPVGSGYHVNHAAGTTTTHPPQPQPQPLPRPPQLRPEEKLRSPRGSSAEKRVDAQINSTGDVPLSGFGLAEPPHIEDEHNPCPGLGPSVSPSLGAFTPLGLTPPRMLAQRPLEVPCIRRSLSPTAKEAGVPGPRLGPSMGAAAAAAAARGREGREEPPHSPRGNRDRPRLEVTAESHSGRAGGTPASPSPPPPPPPSTASSATTCQVSGVVTPALHPRNGGHDASNCGQRIDCPQSLTKRRDAEGEQGRLPPDAACTLSAGRGARSPGVGGGGVGGSGVTCGAVAGGEKSAANCEVSRGGGRPWFAVAGADGAHHPALIS